MIVLGILFFGVGSQVGNFVETNRINPENSANSTGKVESSPSGPKKPAQKPAQASAEESPARETTSEILVSHHEEQKAKKEKKEKMSAAERRAKKEEARQAKIEAAQKAEEEAARKDGEVSDEPLDVLVLGVDRRPSEGEGTASRSDTMMLVRITPSTGEVKLLSVPRDLYVEVEPGEKDKINSAYAYGGVEQATDVMENLTGITVDNYVIVDFEGFSEVIDAIGGVKVNVGHGVFPEKWHMGEGRERLGGRKALFYARYRGTPRADLDRIDHQQKLLAALRRQAFQWNTVTKMPGIIKTTNENVDTDIGIWRAVPLARALIMNGRDASMESSELQGYPTVLDNGEQVLMPEADANEAILKEFRE